MQLKIAAAALGLGILYSIPSFSQSRTHEKEQYQFFDAQKIKKDSIIYDSTRSVPLEEKIAANNAEKNGKPDKYAVLINGSEQTRFIYETSVVYLTLLDAGFKRENVYILDQAGTTFPYAADGIATKDRIKRVFSHLEKKIDEHDTLWVHISDHGDRVLVEKTDFTDIKRDSSMWEEYNSYSNMLSMLPIWGAEDQIMPQNVDKYELITSVVVNGDDPTEKDFEEYLSKIKPSLGVVTTGVCYGGGLARRLGKGKFVGIASSEYDQLASCIIGQSFMVFFYEGLRKNKADMNDDGKATFDEAFIYGYIKNNMPPADEYFQSKWSEVRKQTPIIITEMDFNKIWLK